MSYPKSAYRLILSCSSEHLFLGPSATSTDYFVCPSAGSLSEYPLEHIFLFVFFRSHISYIITPSAFVVGLVHYPWFYLLLFHLASLLAGRPVGARCDPGVDVWAEGRPLAMSQLHLLLDHQAGLVRTCSLGMTFKQCWLVVQCRDDLQAVLVSSAV